MIVMESKLWRTLYTALTVTFTWCSYMAASDPGIYMLDMGCSNYNVSSLSTFANNLNATFGQLRSQLLNNSTFATHQQIIGSDPVYGMVQCRDYMSTADCVACFSAASVRIRNCSSANGGRVVYDGCFLRYERSDFYGETTRDANREYCGNQTTSITPPTAFQATVAELLQELEIATPRIKGFFGASKGQVVGSNNASVHGIAQCVETIDTLGCQACLQVAYRNIQRCPPNSDGRAVDSGCFMRYADKAFFADNQTIDLRPFLKTGSSTNKALIGGIAGGASLALLLLALVVWFKLSRKRKRAPRADILGATELRGPVNYSYKDLKSATKNFNEENKLGEGGFGDVYKGTLKNGKLVAVKKLALVQPRKAEADFKSEVTLISNVHHRNLIRLLGCCNKGPELLLVYEYMANSSLDRFLFGNRRGHLNWKQRVDIILGTAQGLAYLHEQFHISDWQGSYRRIGVMLALDLLGHWGYTAPEYAIHGQLSEKVDTYSYGIVVLEIISGTKSSEMINDPGSEFLLKRAWKLHESGNQIELVDESLDPIEYEAEEVTKIIDIALLCTQPSPTLRPTMSEVIVLLKTKGSVNDRQPTRPTFLETEVRIHGEKSTSTASSSSNANVSISQVSGR